MSHDLGALAGRPVIIGGGIAGLMTALHLAPEPVVLISKAPLGQDSSSLLAQGGIAASLGADDHPSLHAADTMAAGDGLCDAGVVNHVTKAAEDSIETLSRFGVRFDQDDDGRPLLGLEAAHCRRRILHAAGDGTGRELMRSLVAAVRRTPSITVIEAEARRLVLLDGAMAGLIIADAQGAAGAVLADLEFIQFHPTALDAPVRPMPLISEAVRGEGALLIDEAGHRFLADVPGGELARRDVVARAVARHMAEGHRVFLDVRDNIGDAFAARFPAIDSICKIAGINPTREPIPVRPAAHYHMGGIAVDMFGRSSVEGLWACGEAACAGLHGANRLASNSLLEAVVFARAVAQSVAGIEPGGTLRLEHAALPPAADPSPVCPMASTALGLVRNGGNLADTAAALLPMVLSEGPGADPAIVALMIAISAWQRTESRGAHFRSDFACTAETAHRSRLTHGEAVNTARELAATPALPLARSA